MTTRTPRFLAAATLAGLAVLAPVLGAEFSEGEDAQPKLADLAELLEDKDAAKRRRAVRQLAELGGRKAWELVLGALDDEKGQVADEAQLRLADLDEAKLLRGLLGREGLRSKDEWRRWRVAETFGRMTLEVPAEDLVKAVGVRDDQLSEMLLWSLERLAVDQRLVGDVARCGREVKRLVTRRGAARVRAQALCTLARMDLDAALGLARKFEGDRDPLLRAAALEVSLLGEEQAALGACRRLLADESSSVRAVALDGLGEIGNLAAFSLVIERLESEERTRLAARALEILQDLSGMKYRADPRPWRLWVQGQSAGFVPRRGGATTESVTTAALAGLPLESDRLAILIDFSGSLWYEREGRPARKLQVDKLMRESLPRLTEATWFNLIPYTKEPHPWRPELVRATPRNIKAAMADFEAAKMRGSGNVFDAVLLALEDPAVDRVLIFTDGAPTGGRRWNMELIVPLLEQAARWRHIAYDAVLVDTPPGLARRWGDLCQRTGGRSLAVDL
jgi:HEAT repeat protein